MDSKFNHFSIEKRPYFNKMCEKNSSAIFNLISALPIWGVRFLHFPYFDFQIHLGVALQLIETWMEKFNCVKSEEVWFAITDYSFNCLWDASDLSWT